jgi:D-sedoheptulose 7-phosphate isomerase
MKSKHNNIKDIINSYIAELKDCLDDLDHAKIEEAIEILMGAYHKGRKVFIMGNGGSAANASHMACDVAKNTLERVYDLKEKRFKIYSLTDNVATITAFANDLSYDDIFIQQLRNLIEKNDVVVALSGSGNSENVVRAVKYAKKCGAKTIGFVGFGGKGKLGKIVDCVIVTKSTKYGICEDLQLILDHIITTSLSRIKRKGKKE